MAILMLQADGRLDVQDRICQYVDGCPTAWHDVTIHHLLTNSSGIPDFFVPCFSSTDAFEKAIAQAWRQPLLFRPGERWEYSNVGYFLLGTIVEHIAGRPYGTFLQEWLC
jgi:D-alanyl-D-alanine carboxypeptidase